MIDPGPKPDEMIDRIKPFMIYDPDVYQALDFLSLPIADHCFADNSSLYFETKLNVHVHVTYC